MPHRPKSLSVISNFRAMQTLSYQFSSSRFNMYNNTQTSTITIQFYIIPIMLIRPLLA